MKKVVAIILFMMISLCCVSCTEESSSLNNKKRSNSSYSDEEIYIRKYSVNFNTNGGTKVDAVKTNILDSAPSTTRENHVFDGWYLDETFTQAAIFPIELKNDIIIHAKWLKIKNKSNCTDCRIKLDSDIGSSVYYVITPSGFDLQRLSQKGYRTIQINVTYHVCYQKDYNVLWDIGYAGSPKYEVDLENSQGLGKHESDLTTSLSSKTRSVETNIQISDVNSDQITLKFSTNNVQNIIYFTNIQVTYECLK